MNKNVEVFERMSVPQAVKTMAVPTVISQMIVLIYNMADTYFIGRTNDPFMVAGVSLILPIFNIALSLSGLSGVGGGALVSRLLGLKDTEQAKKVSSFCIWFCVFAAAFFSLGVLVFMNPLMHLLGADQNTYAYASQYALCVVVFGGIPTVLSNTLANLLRSTGDSKRAGFGITMGGIINMGLDPLFMFVLFPSGKEILGAGVATCLSNIIACIYFVIVIMRQSEPIIVVLPPNVVPKANNIKSIFNVGIPSSVATLLFDVDYMVLDKLMSAYSGQALAAVGIVLKVERLPLNFGIGLCQGMLPIVAYNYACKNYKRMDETRRYTRKIGLICAAFSIIVYQLFAPYIMEFFIHDAETLAVGIPFLRIRILATPLMFLSFFHVYLFNAFGEGRRALFLGVMRWIAFNIPMLFILNYLIGIYGIVWSQLTADIFTVTLSIAVYNNYIKKGIFN